MNIIERIKKAHGRSGEKMEMVRVYQSGKKINVPKEVFVVAYRCSNCKRIFADITTDPAPQEELICNYCSFERLR